MTGDPPRVTARNRQTRCYELAGRGMLDAAPECNWTLVHGRVTRTDGAAGFGHAWLEQAQRGKVYDPVTDATYDRAAYYSAHSAEALAIYSRAEAVEQMVLTGHWGPWDERIATAVEGSTVARAEPRKGRTDRGP